MADLRESTGIAEFLSTIGPHDGRGRAPAKGAARPPEREANPPSVQIAPVPERWDGSGGPL